jgi:Ca2+-binding EF-hand superfamily protein
MAFFAVGRNQPSRAGLESSDDEGFAMKSTYRWGLAVALATGSVGFAADDDPKGKTQDKRDPAVLFQRLDRNGDGKIGKDERDAAPERARMMLSRADANGDGEVTKEEFLAAGAGKGGRGPKGELQKGKGEPPKGEPGKEAPKPGADRKRKPGKGDGAPMFKRLDANGDGKVSKNEAKGPLADYFDRLDADKDGFLSESEVQSGREKMARKGPRPGKGGDLKPGDDPKGEKAPPKKEGAPDFAMMLQRLDSNADGKISKEEARGPVAENFDRFDANNDGFVSKDEMEAIGKRLEAMGPMRGAFQPEPSFVNLFNQQDVDADGRVTRSEAKAKLLENFDALDADKDGKLTRQEVEAGMKKLGAKQPPKN